MNDKLMSKEPINCLKISGNGNQPVIISGDTAAMALKAINDLYNIQGTPRLMADDASFLAASIDELATAYKATYFRDYEWKKK